MKEVKEKCVAGPFEEIPFKNYIQSPMGLVPKAGNKTRLIFHLSYNFGEGKEENMSLNEVTPREKCTIKYNDLDTAVQHCLAINKEALASDDSEFLDQHEQKGTVFLGKTDLSSALFVAPVNSVDLLVGDDGPRPCRQQMEILCR